MRVLLGLGGNLGEVQAAFRDALAEATERAAVVAVSRLWRSRAVGPPQPEYLNAAAVLEVHDPLERLLAWCLEAERRCGRVRAVRWGPRPIDLDLLLVWGLVRRGRRLALPHPRFHERAFALAPAAEVAGGWVHPLLGRTVADLAAAALAADPTAASPLRPWWEPVRAGAEGKPS